MITPLKLVKINICLYFISAVFLLSSCSKKNNEHLVLEPITLSAEGPYFEGPNSFQGKIGEDVAKYLQEKGYKKEQLKEIKIVKATIALDSLLTDIQDLTLQVVSEKESMQKLGFINPLPSGNQNIQLSIAKEQTELVYYFLEGGTLILDANFLKDKEENVTFKANLELELTLKK
jgi:hypothetical protein